MPNLLLGRKVDVSQLMVTTKSSNEIPIIDERQTENDIWKQVNESLIASMFLVLLTRIFLLGGYCVIIKFKSE